jgi:hypothetical protein
MTNHTSDGFFSIGDKHILYQRFFLHSLNQVVSGEPWCRKAEDRKCLELKKEGDKFQDYTECSLFKTEVSLGQQQDKRIPATL